MGCKNCKCAECKKQNEPEVNRCIKCGKSDILIANCGYSSFNAGTGTCQNCGHKASANNGPWDKNDWIIDAWNYQNPLKNEELRRLREQIKKTKEKIKEVEARAW